MKKTKIISGTIISVSALILIATVIICFKFTLTKVKIITHVDEDASYSIIKNSVTEVYNKISKSSVAVVSTLGSSQASGSGIVYKKEGDTYFVVTNYHVIEGFSKTKILFNDVYENANIVGGDKTNDIAVLTFEFGFNNTKKNDEIKVCDFLNYSTYKVAQIGETALVIGSPISINNYNTLTSGIISYTDCTKIMTDAPINLGNSGGGLFNINGELLGIVQKKEVSIDVNNSIEGRGSAIPLDIVIKSIQDIEESNTIFKRPVLGFGFTAVNKVLNEDSELLQYVPNDNLDTHLILTEMNETVGEIEKGDCLLKINGIEIKTIDEIQALIKKSNLGDKIILTLYKSSENRVFDTEIILK